MTACGHASHIARPELGLGDDQPPYRAAIIDGTLKLIDLGTAGELSNRMTIKYFGAAGATECDKMTRPHREATGETLLLLVPTEVKGFDNTLTMNHTLLRTLESRPTP